MRSAPTKTWSRDLCRHVIPQVDEVFTNKFGKADLAVLDHYGDPRAIVAVGVDALTGFILERSRNNHGRQRAQAWVWAAEAALELLGDDPAVAFRRVGQRSPAAALAGR